MTNKKYNQFDAGTPVGTDITLFANPTTGLLKKVALQDMSPQTIKIQLSAANLMSIFATPLIILAGQAGKIPVIESMVWSFIYGGTQFTGGGVLLINEETSGTSISFGFDTLEMRGTTSLIYDKGSGTSLIPRVSGKGIVLTNSGVSAFAAGNSTVIIYITYHYVTL